MGEIINILHSPSRKLLCIIFVLLISFNFSVGGTQTKICKGGPGCANCVELAHSHMPGAFAEMDNTSCRPGAKNTTCGFEAGRIPHEFDRIALIVRSDHHEFSGIFVAESDVYNRPDPSGELLLQFDSPDIAGAVPIYLLNDSLLC